MPEASEAVLLTAENSNTYVPLGPEDERIETPGYVVWLGSGSHPSFTAVQRLRLREEEVEATVAEIRLLVRERGRRGATWEVGSSATPHDLGERLLALGMTPDREPVAFLAWLGGEPVASATATFTEAGVVLNAGATRRSARGKGAYSALVEARWREAVARGAPALITQAGAMSRPILERLGFQQVAEIRIYLDELDQD